jgi:hypothetical protein
LVANVLALSDELPFMTLCVAMGYNLAHGPTYHKNLKNLLLPCFDYKTIFPILSSFFKNFSQIKKRKFD